jgi:hypothetical protein
MVELIFIFFITLFSKIYSRGTAETINIDSYSQKTIQISSDFLNFCMEFLPESSSILKLPFFTFCDRNRQSQAINLISRGHSTLFNIVPVINSNSFRIDPNNNSSPLIDVWFLQWSSTSFIIMNDLDSSCFKVYFENKIYKAKFDSCSLSSITNSQLFQIHKEDSNKVSYFNILQQSSRSVGLYKIFYVRFNETKIPYRTYYYPLTSDKIVVSNLKIGEYAIYFPMNSSPIRKINVTESSSTVHFDTNMINYNKPDVIKKLEFINQGFFKVCLSCYLKDSQRYSSGNDIRNLSKTFIYCNKGSILNSIYKQCNGNICNFKYRCIESPYVTNSCRKVKSTTINASVLNYSLIALIGNILNCNSSEAMQWLRFVSEGTNFYMMTYCCIIKNVNYTTTYTTGSRSLNDFNNSMYEFVNLGDKMALNGISIKENSVNSNYKWIIYEIKAIVFDDTEAQIPLRTANISSFDLPFNKLCQMSKLNIKCQDSEGINELVFYENIGKFEAKVSCLKSSLISTNCYYNQNKFSIPNSAKESDAYINFASFPKLGCPSNQVINEIIFQMVDLTRCDIYPYTISYTVRCCEGFVKSLDSRDTNFHAGFGNGAWQTNTYIDLKQFSVYLGVNEVLNKLEFNINLGKNQLYILVASLE